MYINYEIIVKVAHPGILIDNDEFTVSAFPLAHTKPCTGFVMEEKLRPGEFHPELASGLGIPMGPLWGKLQKGFSVTLDDGRVIQPSAVMGEAREGRKFSFVTDSQYLPSIATHVRGSDLFICEGMFASDMEATAQEKMHMTAGQAAQIALDAEVKKLALIHYSPRYNDWELKFLAEDAQKIFPNTVLTRDRMRFDIPQKN